MSLPGALLDHFVPGFEGPEVSSPVHRAGICTPPFPKARRADTTCGAPLVLGKLNLASTPPSRTGLLTAGPSDLGHAGD